MAREYSALCNTKKKISTHYIDTDNYESWSVIYKDTDDDAWYIELANAEDKGTAMRLAEALNLREREHAQIDIG